MLDRAAYGNRDELMDDLARIMREEIADLAARGCTYLQMDEVPLAVICDPNNMEVVRERGDDPDELIDLYIDAINNSIKDRPAEHDCVRPSVPRQLCARHGRRRL